MLSKYFPLDISLFCFHLFVNTFFLPPLDQPEASNLLRDHLFPLVNFYMLWDIMFHPPGQTFPATLNLGQGLPSLWP